MTSPLPVTILGGYLGSGKTTLINALLRQADGLRLAVLVNEFGALPIDEDLIESQDGNVISIAGGCICCAFGEDLNAAMDDIAELTPAPDHVLVEASGVAIPDAIAAQLSLRRTSALAGIVVLADAETIEARASDKYVADTIMRQLEGADLIGLTKLDLVGIKEADRVRAWLQQLLDGKPVLEASNGQLLPELLMNVPQPIHPDASAPSHDDQFESFILSPRPGTNAEQLAEFLANGSVGVVRAKGYVTDATGNTVLVQSVGHRWSVHVTDQRQVPGIVCIGPRGQLARRAIESFSAGRKCDLEAS